MFPIYPLFILKFEESCTEQQAIIISKLAGSEKKNKKGHFYLSTLKLLPKLVNFQFMQILYNDVSAQRFFLTCTVRRDKGRQYGII